MIPARVRTLAPYVCVAVVLYVLASFAARGARSTADARAELSVLRAQNGALRAEILVATLERDQAQHDLALGLAETKATLARYDQTRERWGVRLDTLRATDTVRVPVPVLQQADAAIQSCRLTLTTCERAQAADARVIRLLAADTTSKAAQLDALGRSIPSAAQRRWHDVKLAGAVGGTVYLLHRLNLLP